MSREVMVERKALSVRDVPRLKTRYLKMGFEDDDRPWQEHGIYLLDHMAMQFCHAPVPHFSHPATGYATVFL